MSKHNQDKTKKNNIKMRNTIEISEEKTIELRYEELLRLKKRASYPKNSKLKRYDYLIITLREVHKASYGDISFYLQKHHKLKTTRANVRHFYNRILAIAKTESIFN